jgi:hypothetical protein
MTKDDIENMLSFLVVYSSHGFQSIELGRNVPKAKDVQFSRIGSRTQELAPDPKPF